MELLIIRHGQSTNNLTMLLNPKDRGEHDPSLTELGHQQARAVGEYLATHMDIDRWIDEVPVTRQAVKGFGITHLYCSPMLRTLQTCQPISQALNMQPEVWVDIHEHGGIFMDYGDERGVVGFGGLTRSQIQEGFPDYELPSGVTEQGWWNPANGQEDIGGCMARTIRVAKSLRRRAASNDRIALVTHGTFGDVLLKTLFNTLPNHDMRFAHYNTAISRVDFRADGITMLRYLNRVDHLKPEMMSW